MTPEEAARRLTAGGFAADIYRVRDGAVVVLASDPRSKSVSLVILSEKDGLWAVRNGTGGRPWLTDVSAERAVARAEEALSAWRLAE